MIFADMQYEEHYSDIHQSLVALLKTRFSNLQHGLQGDSWLWIFEEGTRVEIDTFYSMKHQVKCSERDSGFPARVIELLATRYILEIYAEPELESHEY